MELFRFKPIYPETKKIYLITLYAFQAFFKATDFA